ncbi:potassium channel family protein [Rhodococcus sp. WAY2]|uniref:potassium channel family protein n=1 Tax=Rhodococcus sp. WAY2 TaxID=2663121 RepID=UPI00131FF2CB|nr:potassium channel family protein [Rhodococcus sp. WAY2]QHE72717.1 hypothetical protein GFS60_06365 [Rhodococcus sp. WAY2]
MTWPLTAVGSLLIGAALRDIFSTLWHPRGLGTICRLLFSLVWRVLGALDGRGRLLNSAGPVAMVSTVLAWSAMMVLGWAAIYLPHMPDGFYFSTALPPTVASEPVAALYLSLVTVATLGYGDITPAYPALRMLIPVQALIGFVLFTAAISWVLQIYPALSRRRAAAQRITMMADTGVVAVLPRVEPGTAIQLLGSVTEALTTIELDVMQYQETYFFRDAEPALSLAAALSFVPELAAAGSSSAWREVRWAADMLDTQAERLARRLDAQYLHTGAGTREVFDAFAQDHRHRPLFHR